MPGTVWLGKPEPQADPVASDSPCWDQLQAPEGMCYFIFMQALVLSHLHSSDLFLCLFPAGEDSQGAGDRRSV